MKGPGQCLHDLALLGLHWGSRAFGGLHNVVGRPRDARGAAIQRKNAPWACRAPVDDDAIVHHDTGRRCILLSGEISIRQIIATGLRAAGDRIRGVATDAAEALRTIAGLRGDMARHGGDGWSRCPASMSTKHRGQVLESINLEITLEIDFCTTSNKPSTKNDPPL